ncbi:DegV family protein [Siminovitchia sediminis]|uniref:DegV family protein n=1 Tax=Siminovitchia sediminis TaxID=1274353 RepID=A0ABW4KFU2_9BACI
MSLKLFADSACDLPVSFFEEHQIQLVTLQVHIDDQEYKDLVNIQPQQVYDAIRNGKTPKTSQASPQQLHELFTELAKSGQSGLYIAMSSGLSGTYQTAVMVKEQVKEEFPDLDLTVLDSKAVSLGYGLIVMAVAEKIQNNEPKEEIIRFAEASCKRIEHLFTIGDLEFLAKGGRLSKSSAFFGGLLNIRPFLHVEEGKLVPLEKIRGKKKLFKKILDTMEERGVDLENQMIGISHGDDEESALELKGMIEERFGTKKFYIKLIGATVASHAGLGTLAVFFFNERNR